MRSQLTAAVLAVITAQGISLAQAPVPPAGGAPAPRPTPPVAAPTPPPPPTLEELQAELAALASSGFPQRAALLRRFALVKTPACARFLAGLLETEQDIMLRGELLRVLGQVGAPPAADVLRRLATEGVPTERPTALSALAGIRPPVGVDPFLSALAPGEPLPLRLAAAQALQSYPTPDVAAALAGLLLEEPAQPALRQTCRATLGVLARSDGVRDWLAETALARGTPLRGALPELLGIAGGCGRARSLEDAVCAHLRDPDPAVRSSAADALGRLAAGLGAEAEHVQEELRGLLRDADGGVVVSAAVALGAIGPSAKSLDALVAMGRTRAPGLRALALSSLEGSLDERVLELAAKGLEDKAPNVRAAAVACLRAMRSKPAVDALVEGLKKNKSGRIAVELERALRALTGANPGDGYKEWRRWWDLVRGDFELPSSGQVAAGVRSGSATATRGLPTYYGTEVISERVTFIVDISGSMSAPVAGEEPTRTRIEVCKQELAGVIQALPKRAFFNVLWFHHTFQSWSPQLAPAAASQKGSALEAVGRLQAGGGTNIFDPLEAALLDPEVDTVYLLSDGGPSAGRFIDPEAILREVKKLNAVRRVAIHTISIGGPSPFMHSLAEQNGGQAIDR